MIKSYKYSLFLALLILYLSLKNADDLNKVQFLNIPHFDKIAHFCMYFALMSVIILENRRSSLINRSVVLLALFPFIYGIILEILQTTLTATRSGDPVDVAFNSLGILFSMLIWLMIRRVYREKFR